MALSADLDTALSHETPPVGCKLAKLVMSPEDHERVELYVEKIRQDKELPQHLRFFTVAGLTEILARNGYEVGKTVISEHVRKVCLCERSD